MILHFVIFLKNKNKKFFNETSKNVHIQRTRKSNVSEGEHIFLGLTICNAIPRTRSKTIDYNDINTVKTLNNEFTIITNQKLSQIKYQMTSYDANLHG
jgi:hypothetical protein